jgi:hypothetical protein
MLRSPLIIKKSIIRLLQKSIPVFLLLFSISETAGQTDFQPGYIITIENDTIIGLIDYRGDIRNSKKCSFKPDENSQSIEYNPFEIKGFRFVNGKFYLSRSVLIENSQDSIFAEYLVNGITDLFYYRNLDQDHYLLEKNDGEIFELTNEKIYGYDDDRNTRYIRNSNKYIGLLKVAFSDCVELYPEVDKTELNHKSLIDVTKNYHDYVCKDQECIIYEKLLPVIKIKFAPVINLNLSSIKIGDDSFYSLFNFNKSVSISAGGILNISLPRLNNKLSTQIEVLTGENYFYGFLKYDEIPRIYYYDFHIRSVYLNGLISLKYTYPKGKIRPIGNLGFSLYHSVHPEYKIILEQVSGSTVYTYENNTIPIPDFLYGGFGKIGVNYYLNEEIFLFLTLSYNLNYGQNVDASIFINTFGINLGIFL